MLSPHVQDSLVQLASARMEDCIREFNHAAGAITTSMVSRGAGLSGGHLLSLDSEAARSLASASEILLQDFLNAHAAEPASEIVSRVAHLTTLFSGTLDHLGGDLGAALEVRIARFRDRLGFSVPLTKLPEALAQAHRKQEARLRFAVMASHHDMKMQSEPGNQRPTMTINGNVGVVQTGDGAVGHVVQHNAAPSPEQLLAALASLEAAIRSHAGPAQLSHVLELLEDLREQTQRTTPNKLKVSSILGGLATLVSTIPNVQPAWETVQNWAGTVKDFISG